MPRHHLHIFPKLSTKSTCLRIPAWLSKILSLLLVLFWAMGGRAQSAVRLDLAPTSALQQTHAQLQVNVIGTWAKASLRLRYHNAGREAVEAQLRVFPEPGSRLLGHSVGRHAAVPLPIRQAPLGSQVAVPVDARTWDAEGRFADLLLPFRIPAGASESVQLSWEFHLSPQQGGLRLELPVALFRADSASLDLTVSNQSFAPEGKFPGVVLPAFKKRQDDYVLNADWAAPQPSGPLRIFLPANLEPDKVFWEAGKPATFAVETEVPLAPRERHAAQQIHLFWDASLSGLHRDHALELATLDRYLAAARHSELQLTVFRERPEPPRRFSLDEDGRQALRAALDSLVYDGATCLECLPWAALRKGEVLLVSDGGTTWLERSTPPTCARPVYAFHAGPAADAATLQTLGTQSQGRYLGRIHDDSLATVALLSESPTLVGISYPRSRIQHVTTEQNGSTWTLLGRMKGSSAKIKATWGYPGQKSLRKTFQLQYAEHQDQTPGLMRRWAQALVDDATGPSPLVDSLVRRHSLRSAWTELTVLRDPMAYLAAGFLPPGSSKHSRDSLILLRQTATSHLDTLAARALQDRQRALIELWQDRREWYTQGQRKTATPTSAPDTLRLDTLLPIRGWVRDAQGLPICGARIAVAATGDTLFSDRMGAFRLLSDRPQIQLHVAADGYWGRSMRVEAGAFPILQLRSTDPGKRVRSTAEALLRPPLAWPRPPADVRGRIVLDGFLQDSFPGAALAAPIGLVECVWREGAWTRYRQDGEGFVAWITPTGKARGWRSDALIRPVPWDSAVRYLDSLEAAPKGQAYAAYLKQRLIFGHMPAFFLDAGDWFAVKGDTATAIRIWSNLSELQVPSGALARTTAHRLLRVGATSPALRLFRLAVQADSLEPHGPRDLALALAQCGRHAEAAALLEQAAQADWAELSDYFGGIEAVLLNDWHGLPGRRSGNWPAELAAPMPVDLRITVDWNRMEADVDLWVIGPDSQRCDYKTRETGWGGLLTQDFADGYGPEEFLLRNAPEGTYTIGLDFHDEDLANLVGVCLAKVSVWSHFGSEKARMTSFWLPLQGKRCTRIVAKLVWKGGIARFE